MKLPKLPDRTKELYAEYHPQALGYEKKIGELMRGKAELLGKKKKGRGGGGFSPKKIEF